MTDQICVLGAKVLLGSTCNSSVAPGFGAPTRIHVAGLSPWWTSASSRSRYGVRGSADQLWSNCRAALPQLNGSERSTLLGRSLRQVYALGSYPLPTSRLYKAWDPIQNHTTLFSCSTASRSEERRVGKECRSRWSP